MKGKKTILLLAIFLILQTLIYICIGINKAYLHIDEAYSFGLTNYDKIEIQDNEDFFNTWHSKEYFEDYLSIQKDELFNYSPVYENQKNDVHPPLYYLLLRFFMGFTNGHFSIWPGIILNIIIYCFITIFMYLILKKIFKNEHSSNIKALFLAFMSSIILASLSNVINVRMYSLSTLNILITTFLHIKLLENNKVDFRLLVALGFSVLSGILTHYYYLFYLCTLYLTFFIKYIKCKQLKNLIYYTVTVVISGITSLIIFPYSLQHIFFGYRGQGVLSNLGNIYEIIPSIFSQIYNLNYYVFNGLMPIIISLIIVLLIYIKISKKDNIKIDKKNKEILKIIYLPTIFFFILTSISSPWRVLRYIVPVCGLIFILVIYYLYILLQTKFSEKFTNIFISILFCIILVTPLFLHLKPELLYDDRKQIIQDIKGDLNVPTIYLFNSQEGGFLDDILLFSIINNSYIAKDINYEEDNIKKILEDKNISKGIIILINGNQDNSNVLDIVKKSLNFTNCDYLQKLSSCEAYYIH